MARDVQFEIALSFASEDRPYVDQVAHLLHTSGVKVFYENFEESTLCGKNLYEYLTDLYQDKALYTIIFISEHYSRKLWTNPEREAMQSRAFQENQDYVLPVRFDDTQIPGVLPNTAYISLDGRTPAEFNKLIQKKLISTGRTIPSEQIRTAVYSLVASPKSDPTRASVCVVDEDGIPLAGASLCAFSDNNTYKVAQTDSHGLASFVFPTRRLQRVLIAHPKCPGAVIDAWDPADSLRVVLSQSENTGSVIFDSSGKIPGLEGRLTPIVDRENRTYLYADNIAIREGVLQPAEFKVGVPLLLEDSNGTFMQITILHIQGKQSLVQFVHLRHDLGFS